MTEETGLPKRFQITGGNPLLFLVCLVIFVDSIGYGVVVPVLPEYAKSLGVGDFQVGFLYATYAIALLLTAIPFGMLSDRLGRKPFVLFGMYAMAGAFIFYALADSYWILVIARILDGVTAAATWSAGLALAGDRFPREQMGSKMGYALMAMSLGSIAGPLLGGVLNDAIGYSAPFYTIAIICFIGGTLSLFLKKEKPSNLRKTRSYRELLAPVFKNKIVLLACLVSMSFTVGLGLLEPMLPLHLESKFSMSPAAIGAVFGVTALCVGVMSPISGKLSDRMGRKGPLIAGLISTAIVSPFIALANRVFLVFLLMAALGITAAIFTTPSVSLITDALEDEDSGGQYGTGFGLQNFSWSLGMVIGPLVGSALVDVLGLFWTLCIFSVLVLGMVPIVQVVLKEDVSKVASEA